MVFPRCFVIGLLLAGGLVSSEWGFSANAADRADPAFYVKTGNWQESLRLSREALVRAAAAQEERDAARWAADPASKTFEPLSIELSGKRPPRHIRVRVAGLKEIYLGVHGGAGVIAAPVLIDRDGQTESLNFYRPKLPLLGNPKPGKMTEPFVVEGKPVRNCKPWTNAEGQLQLDGKQEWFEAWIGLPPNSGNRTATFTVDRQSHIMRQKKREADRQLIRQLVERDFLEDALANGGTIDDPDNIWQLDWPAGDFRHLALRYAKLCHGDALCREAAALARAATSADDLAKVRRLYDVSQRFRTVAERAQAADVEALRLAVQDLREKFPTRYAHGAAYLRRIDAFEKNREELIEAVGQGDAAALEQLEQTLAVLREAMLANPLLDFEQLLLLKRTFGPSARSVMSAALGLPSLNSRTHDTIPHNGWNNEIAVLSDLRGSARMETVYKPAEDIILSDVDLHFDADRLMFSSIGTHDRWQLFEIGVDGSGLKQLTPTDLPDVDFFDSCYLPSGKVAVTSTACYQGLPCEGGKRPMACLYLLDPATRAIRQLTFEQDSDWCPTVLNNGRLMYLRWEYTDAPHYFTRILFHCNPDGTNQVEYYGSNSYFPNAFYYARPLPGDPTKVVGIASGHHGISRSGRMLILDPAKGRHEADGVVQEIPGRGKTVEPIIVDRLVDGVWPQFLNPFPLSDNYYLVAAKLTEKSLWGIYLVDVFDNMTLLKEVPGAALLEPLPLRPTRTPPLIPEKVDMNRKDSLVFLTDIYLGAGLKDVPRGTVKKLRLFAYHFGYIGTGGHASVGVESSWDIKRILGTVPVEEDGSALFQIPANTPISIQPLDEEGRALQLMRSWMVGMPGETVSCVGCHEQQNDVVPSRRTIASVRAPSRIEPWYGPPRPFGFVHEVQPVLDEYCVGCHNGEPADGHEIADFRGPTTDVLPDYAENKSYMALQPYVRRPGPESDYHMLLPMEYHAGTSELVQMLEKGHHNVQLDREAWDRLYTWIDLNVPYRANWAPNDWREQEQCERRLELARRYANIDVNPEQEYEVMVKRFATRKPIRPIMPEPLPKIDVQIPNVPGWPMTAQQARRLQAAAGSPIQQTLRLGTDFEGNPIELKLGRIPAGQFVMGDAAGDLDEQLISRATIDRPFWMGTIEVTNAQFNQFDPTHDSRYIDMSHKDQSKRGHPHNRPEQPVVRVTWQRAMAFCRWLSERTGRRFTLPTESQWEWACRAGTATPMSYGAVDDDFSPYANLADKALPSTAKGGLAPFPRIADVDDGQGIPSQTAAYRPNVWGLYDMHGSVAEWTRSAYHAYPYDPADGRNALDAPGRRVVRGGSWRDRPRRARSSFRLSYETYQPVVNVGFRVVCEED
ncbi:MAG: SUMF1/EgtB/PvdO family nonheme iron enzyme [Thermoguttaceae bacterium]